MLSNLQATTCRTHAGTLAIPSHNSKNASASYPWDITQSLVDHVHPKQAKHNVCFIKNCMAFHTSCQAKKASRLPSGHLTSLGAIRFPKPLPDLFCLAGSHFSPNAMRSKLLWFSLITWQHTPNCQAALAKHHAFQASLVFPYHLTAHPKLPSSTPQAARCHTSSVIATSF